MNACFVLLYALCVFCWSSVQSKYIYIVYGVAPPKIINFKKWNAYRQSKINWPGLVPKACEISWCLLINHCLFDQTENDQNSPRPLASRRVDPVTKQQTLQTSKTFENKLPRGRVYSPPTHSLTVRLAESEPVLESSWRRWAFKIC